MLVNGTKCTPKLYMRAASVDLAGSALLLALGFWESGIFASLIVGQQRHLDDLIFEKFSPELSGKLAKTKSDKLTI